MPAAAIDGRRDKGGWALWAADGDSHRLVVEATEPLGTSDETTLTVVLHQNAGERAYAGALPHGGDHRVSSGSHRARPRDFAGDPRRRQGGPRPEVEGTERRAGQLLPADRSRARRRTRRAPGRRAPEGRRSSRTSPSPSSTTTQEPDVGAHPSPWQLAERVGRGRGARGSALPAASPTRAAGARRASISPAG